MTSRLIFLSLVGRNYSHHSGFGVRVSSKDQDMSGMPAARLLLTSPKPSFIVDHRLSATCSCIYESRANLHLAPQASMRALTIDDTLSSLSSRQNLTFASLELTGRPVISNPAATSASTTFKLGSVSRRTFRRDVMQFSWLTESTTSDSSSSLDGIEAGRWVCKTLKSQARCRASRLHGIVSSGHWHCEVDLGSRFLRLDISWNGIVVPNRIAVSLDRAPVLVPQVMADLDLDMGVMFRHSLGSLSRNQQLCPCNGLISQAVLTDIVRSTEVRGVDLGGRNIFAENTQELGLVSPLGIERNIELSLT